MAKWHSFAYTRGSVFSQNAAQKRVRNAKVSTFLANIDANLSTTHDVETPYTNAMHA